ncbi:Modifier of rudimentary, Modr [Niveomyces insectorum RCEF 264]|uniref:Modifier of rudimentary, Modr n=1 Tax=Niveomyces insectorum RCEF 264 TaxID=1081102 RepID=A0A167U1A3_9HYPO|nr:Modifier of rudimentary, Modr [Niveomyces insectorum RCEF 264]
MYATTAPIPPPKPGSHDASGRGTPTTAQSPRAPPLPPTPTGLPAAGAQTRNAALPQSIPDPGNNWLPKVLQDKSKQDLAEVLSSPELLSALTHSSSTIHPSLAASHVALQSALDENMEIASHLLELEARLAQQRSATQAQLLGAHALERTWRAKQAAMDAALAPFAPASLYQQLAAGINEQEQVCQALEESFLEGAADGALASEREASEWVRRYREARKLYYLRQERKGRWDEGRVGGWR